MQYTYSDMCFSEVYPNLSYGQKDAIRAFWREFYENPEKYKGTELETIVFKWLERGGKHEAEKRENPWDF